MGKSGLPIDDQYARRTKFIVRVIEGATVEELAAEFDVTRRTIYAWQQRPKVRAEIDAASRNVAATASRRIASSWIESIDGIKELAKKSDSDSVRLAAYKTLLESLDKTLDRMAKLTADGTLPEGQPAGHANVSITSGYLHVAVEEDGGVRNLFG